jgi:ABC-2 type transport system permease protein
MEYRFAFYSEIFINFFSYVVTYAGIWIILNKFQVINGWELWDIMLLYNLNLFSYGLGSLFFFVPLQELESMVHNGSFDGILIRPMNPLLHLLASRQRYVGFLGHIILGTIVFILCFARLEIEWSFVKVLYLLSVLVGASFIHIAIILFTCSISLWLVQSMAIRDIIIYDTRRFMDYPISIYGTVIQVILTFIIPYAFINFYPAQYFLGGKGGTLFHPILQYLTPAVGLFLSTLAYKFWQTGINHYESTGS